MKKLRIILLSIFSILLTISCEIGLGSSVDTEAPALYILNPPVDSIIRDSFLLSGSYTDDGTVVSVSAKLQRTDGSTNIINLTGTVEENSVKRGTGNWKVTISPINEKGETEIIDGTYQASVYIKDASGHTTTQNTTFTIDNTAPIMLLSRPSTIAEAGKVSFDSYGRTFSIEGKAADDNEVSRIEVNIYENLDSDTPIASIPLDNIPLTIEKEIASYTANEANIYAQIYGHTDENGVIIADEIGAASQRYCSFTIYDNAQRFPVDGSEQTADDKKGNKTEDYYMDSILSEVFLNEYNTTELYHIKNGTKNITEAGKLNSSEVLKKLAENAVNKSQFSINPANNPKFVVSSVNILDSGKDMSNDVAYQFSAGNRYLEVEVSPGLDGYLIMPDTVGVYLQECNSTGVIDKTKSPVTIIKPGKEFHIEDENTEQELPFGSAFISLSGKSYKFKTVRTIDSSNYDVQTEKYYVVVVEGNDSQGKDNGKIISEGLYAFKLKSNLEKIEIDTNCSLNYISQNKVAWTEYPDSKLKINLKWGDSATPYALYRKVDSKDAEIEQKLKAITDSQDREYTDELTYEQLKELGSNGAFPHSLIYYIKRTTGNEDNEVISIYATVVLNYDSTAPGISNIQFTNAYEKVEETNNNGLIIEDSTYYLNNKEGKKYSISGIATDDTGIESIKLIIPGLDSRTSTSARFSFADLNFDNISPDGNGGVTADIIVTDLAGNQTKKTLKIIFDNNPPVGIHKLDAKGKDIVFRIGNYDNTEVSTNEDKDIDVGGKYSNQTYGNSETVKVRGEFSDSGSGLDMLYYKVYHTKPGETESFYKNYETECDGTVAFLSGDKIIKKRVFYTQSYQKDGTTISVDYGEDNIAGKYYLDDVESNFYAPISGLSVGENYLVFVAVDKVGNSIVEKPYDENNYYYLNVDTEGPEIIANDDTIRYSNATQTFNLNGSVLDIPAGIDTLEVYANIYKEKGGTEKKKISFNVNLQPDIASYPIDGSTEELSDEIKAERCKTWNATIDTSKLKYDNGEIYEGTVSVYATAKDKAGTGNTATISIGTIIMDSIAPEVTIKAPSDADKYTAGVQVNEKISLTGTAADAKGLKEGNGNIILYYTRNETLGTKSVITSADIWNELTTPNPDQKFVELKTSENENSWTFSNINTNTLKEGSSEESTLDVWFVVASKDIADNVGYSAPCKVTVDPQSDRPVISFTSGLTIKDGICEANPSWVKNSQIRGIVEDDDTISNMWYSFDSTEWISCYETGSLEFTINLPTDGSKDNEHKLYFKVKEAGDTIKEFITKAAASSQEALSSPKLLAQKENNEDVIIGNSDGKYDSIVYLNIDLVDPTLPVIAYTLDDCSAVTNMEGVIINGNQTKDSADIKWKDLATSIVTGGPSEKLYVLTKACDANGIKSIQLLYDSVEINSIKSESVNDGKEQISLFEIDISSISIAEKSITIIATDNADKPINKGFTNICIDRKPPVVSIINPSKNDSVYGNEGVADNRVTVSGRADDDNGIDKVWMAITKSETDMPSEYYDISTENTNAIVAVFNGDVDNVNNHKDECYLELFNSYVNVLYGQGTSYNEYKKNVCLWIYAVDKLNNSGIESPSKLPLVILTQGDKPEVEISYPKEDMTLGGTITLAGSTTIATDTVEDVFIQIDKDYKNGVFSENWETELKSSENWANVEYSIESTGLEAPYDHAIKAQGAPQNWYLTTNLHSELNKADKSNSIIAIRVLAVGKNNRKISEIKELHFNLDPGSPIFGNVNKMRLVQFANNAEGAGNETASILYTEGMWIQGKWWLTGSVEDDSGIGTISLTETNETGINRPPEDIKVKSTPFGNSNYIIKVPVGSPIGSEECYGPNFKLSAVEAQGGKTTEYTVSLNCDNEAPQFEATSLSEISGNSIIQTEGTYQISGTFNDGQGSGFKRIVFYITRDIKVGNDTVSYLTDIMKVQGTSESGIPENCYQQSDFTVPQSNTDLYWKTISNCTASNMHVTLPQDIPSFVHNGSLCRINNVMYLIKSVDTVENTIMLDTAAIDSDSVSVDFTIAQVIDNTVSETGRTTYFGDTSNKIANDDGDQMVESYTKSTNAWTVAINSQNIKDGVISIHFVAFDAAGNATYKNYSGTVSNNRPRIAGVKFGSDVDGSGTVTENEMKTMYSGLYNRTSQNKVENVTVNGQSPNGNKIYSLALPNDGNSISVLSGNPILTVKGNVKIIPEVVGGNDGLSWTYYVGDKDDANIIKDSNGKRIVTQMASTHSDDIREEETPIELTVSNLHGITDGAKDFHFQIWDHTSGTEIGYTSNRADLSLRFYVALNDGEEPTALIKPFYWVDSSINSIYYELINSKKISKGHIELEADLPSDTFNEMTGLHDKDPKLSGIVYLEGIAKDNVAVDELWLKFTGLTASDDFIKIAAREKENPDTLGSWKALTDLQNNGIKFISADEVVETEENGLDYNVVYWKVAIDTAKIDEIADTDRQIQVMVMDRGGLNEDGTFGKNQKASSVENLSQTSVSAVKWSVAKTQSTSFYLDMDCTTLITQKNSKTLSDDTTVYEDNRSPSYRVDVVPYITGITTKLGKLKQNNPSVYGRTALGHYTVSSDEEIIFAGYNLGDNTTLDISTLSSSGAYDFEINGVKALHNENNNDSRGSYSKTVNLNDNPTGDKTIYDNYYNRQPNGDNNNLLTDDIVFDIWGINSEAGKPKSGPLSQPVMAINPKNKQVGFAFASGPLNFSMGSLDKSYDVWEQGLDFWTSIGFAYDANGNSFGTTAGGDINGNPSADAFGIFTSRWGKGFYDQSYGHNNGTGQLRIELVGQGESTDGSTFDGNNINKERIQSSSIATTVANATATSTTVYLAYYDAINEEIRFKWGILENATNKVRSKNNLFYDYYGPTSVSGDAKTDNSEGTKSLTGSKLVKDLPYTLEYVSLIAGQTKNKKTFYKGSDNKNHNYQANTAVMTREGAPVHAGQYVSIAARKGAGNTYNIGTEQEPVSFTDDLVVAVWYDATNNQMLYSYNKTPQKITAPTYKGDNTYLGKNEDGSDKGIDSFSQAATGWSTPVAIFGEGNGIGEYCKVVIDGEGNVHIACYDNGNADVWYAYLDNFDAPASAKTCIVDSYGIVGTELSIDVAIKDSNPVPYISYYGSSCARPKVAYWASEESIADVSSISGAEDESFTKNWEVSVIPSNSKISIDHINVGVWKDNSGNLTYSTTDENVPNGITPGSAGANVGNSTAENSNGMIYGNGSKNPILGYAITKGAGGFIETAQMK